MYVGWATWYLFLSHITPTEGGQVVFVAFWQLKGEKESLIEQKVTVFCNSKKTNLISKQKKKKKKKKKKKREFGNKRLEDVSATHGKRRAISSLIKSY